MSIPITSTLGVPPLQEKNVDEDDESRPEQGKRTPTSAKSLSGLVRSKGAKARPETITFTQCQKEKLQQVGHCRCLKYTVTAAIPSPGR